MKAYVKVRIFTKAKPWMRLVLGHKILSSAGLKPGDFVEINIEDGKIVITKVKE